MLKPGASDEFINRILDEVSDHLQYLFDNGATVVEMRAFGEYLISGISDVCSSHILHQTIIHQWNNGQDDPSIPPT